MTLPRELKLIYNGKHLVVASEPIRELKDLKSEAKNVGDISVNKEYTINKLFETENSTYEIDMTLIPNGSSKFSFTLSKRACRTCYLT
jgi:fructan beta-fructosidase